MILVKSRKFAALFTLGSLCSLGRYVHAAQHLLYHVYLTMSWLLFISVFHFCGVHGHMSSTFSLAIVYHSLSLTLALPQLPSTVHAAYVYLSHDLIFNLQGFSPSSQLHSTVLTLICAIAQILAVLW